MKLYTCTLTRDFDFTGLHRGIRDYDAGHLVGATYDASAQALFIAAPETLAALKRLREVLRDQIRLHGVDMPWAQSALKQADAAILEAERRA